MSTGRRRPITFPFYLRKEQGHTAALGWFGKRLKRARSGAKKTTRTVAVAAKVSIEQILALGKGGFNLNVGLLRSIVLNGYKVVFEDLLAECYEANRGYFDPTEEHRFDRDYDYSLCREAGGEGGDDRYPTPLLIGGDPKRYLWAIPMRRLKDQPLVTDLLELAPLRALKPSGATPDNAHSGIEVVHVIHGAI